LSRFFRFFGKKCVNIRKGSPIQKDAPEWGSLECPAVWGLPEVDLFVLGSLSLPAQKSDLSERSTEGNPKYKNIKHLFYQRACFLNI